MNNSRQALRHDRGNAQRGQAMIEFALCFLLFLGTIVGFGQLAMAVWIKTTLHHAVREGARFAITGQTIGGAGQDSSIRQVVSRSTAGVLTPAQAASLVTIEFFDQAGAVQSIQPIWTPPASPTAGAIFPGGVPLSGFRDTAPNFNQTSPSNAWRENIAANSVDNLARLIRQDTNLNVRIHTIGYQGTDPLQYDVLERLANCDGCTRVDPNDAIDPTQSKGRFVAALNQDELLSAFLDVAGFIGRIVE